MKTRNWIFLLLALILAAVLRIDFLAANNFVVDSDEAIVGLMAKHIIEGGDIPAFYYGQHYMGSFEALSAALVFKISGVSPAALKFVPLVFSLLLVALVYWLAGLVAGELSAKIAALLCAVPPVGLVVWSGMARGGFIEILVIGTASLISTVYWLREEDVSSKKSFLLTVLTGLFFGFGWWVNNQIIYFALPAGFFFLGRLLHSPGSWKAWFCGLVSHGSAGLAGFLAGGAPFWIYNLRHDFASFGMFGRAPLKEILEHLAGVFQVALPILLGAKRFWHTEDIYPFSTLLVWFLYLVMAGMYVLWRKREIGQLFVLKSGLQNALELPAALILSCVAVFSVSSFGWLFTAPRYLLPAYVGIFVVSGAVISHLLEEKRRLGAALLCAILVINLCSSYLGGRALPGEPFIYEQDRASKDHSELIAWLEKNRISRVRTNYWIGYRLAFESREKVTFYMFGDPFQIRVPAYEAARRDINRYAIPFVLVPSQAGRVKRAFEANHIDFREITLSGYVVFYDIRKTHPGRLCHKIVTDLHAMSNYNPGAAALATDKNTETRWGSAHPQANDMFFRLDLEKPADVSAIIFELGKYTTDYARELAVDFEKPDGTIVRVFPLPGAAADSWEAVRYLYGNSHELKLDFRPEVAKSIILRQTGKDRVFDWSIAEIRVLSCR